MKRTILLALIPLLSCFGLTGCGETPTTSNEQFILENQEKAQVVISLIDNIGKVTLNSKNQIENAEKEYNKLTSLQKGFVTNYSTLVNARTKYDQLYKEYKEEETKDDPSRTIVLSDLNGTWVSSSTTWCIGDVNDGKSVLYYTSAEIAPGGVIIGSEHIPSSYLIGYNCLTTQMEISLYRWSGKTSLCGYHTIGMTKSSTGTLAIHYENSIFYLES